METNKEQATPQGVEECFCKAIDLGITRKNNIK